MRFLLLQENNYLKVRPFEILSPMGVADGARWGIKLELFCCKKWQKNNRGNRGCLKVLNGTK